MALHEADREDLLRQATALVERAELTIPQLLEPVVVGFRRDGSASFYWGADPVYQFNTAGELRRAYLGGLLYKADRGQLWKMRRERKDGQVVLHSVELTDREAQDLLAVMRSHLDALANALRRGQFAVTGEVPAGGRVVDRIQAWLAVCPGEIRIANRPHAG